MNKYVIGVVCLALAVLGVLAPHAAEEKKAPIDGDNPPTRVKDNRLTFTFSDLNGGKVSYSDPRFKGKVLFVTVWGTWCPTCNTEISFLKRMHEKYHDKGLEILAVAFERFPDEQNISRLAKFRDKESLPYTVLYGGRTGEVKSKLPYVEDFIGFPTAFFVGRDGLVKAIKGDFVPGVTAEHAEELIQRLLAEKP